MSRDSEPPPPASGSTLVVAHPDDETLWLEPWLGVGSTVLVAFPNHPRESAVTAARESVRERFPYGAMEFLPLQSLDVLGRSDWRRRRPTEYGVELRADVPAELRRSYVDNHRRLNDLLAERLAPGSTVYTHNPWGEYGHEEHIQVCRSVLDVGARLGLSVWVWDGLSESVLRESHMRLRADFFPGLAAAVPGTSRDLDRVRYRELKAIYQSADAWTWDADYEPPASMAYLEIMHGGRELVAPSRPRTLARTAGIFAGHLRSLPRVARRVAVGRGPRSGQ